MNVVVGNKECGNGSGLEEPFIVSTTPGGGFIVQVARSSCREALLSALPYITRIKTTSRHLNDEAHPPLQPHQLTKWPISPPQQSFPPQ